MPQLALKVIRPLVRASSVVSPRWTGRLAFRLFCTPMRHAPVNRRKANIRRAEALFATGKHSFVTHGCGFVKIVRFAPEGESRGTVLVLHGWTGQGLFMAGFVEPLLAHGFSVLVMDMPAHGASSGRILNFPIGVEAISAVVRGSQPLAGIIAHSFGGAVAAVALGGAIDAFAPVKAKAFVSIAAPAAMQGYGRQFSERLGLTRRGHQAFEDRVLEIAGRPMDSFSGRAFLGLSQPRALIIHASDDREIPIADAEELAQAPNARLMRVDGLGHRRILASREVQQAAADFIAG
ncbi:MAG: alpha/beta fold hydrolase [Methylobacterium sp.]|jgi:pimeloyl-ACP methyl ester carboxylesterase|nr:alpha/beta fold hydrolase [Methylobacterium sp.]MCA3603725.1 alpha/beta fold hydrolase [Methylobacterium sp.]MCA3615399.1 alpha/beta fold hydrolase [Methylobacterium sp.]MCA3627531.1 alpha/beta fold hydrolase [Methylobacterium sp.]MCA4909186.1 alpha/beta fold hydrolase [Methylobacterium sp.]